MDKIIEKKYVCKFCNKMFPSGKSLGGHIRIHTNEYSVASDSYNLKKNKKRLVDQQQLQLCCRVCGKGFVSSKALCGHMACHSEREKIVMDTQSYTETSRRKRSKKQSFSSSPSSSASEIDQEHRNTALSLMMMSIDSKGHNLVVNSLVAESSENNSEILETKASSGEQLKLIFNVKNQDLKTDQLRSADGDDSYSSDDSDYFMNGPKKSGSDVSVDRVLPCYETVSCADTNIKIHRSSDSKSPVVKKASGANKNSNGHECPTCFKVFKSGQALGGHKRSHFVENQEQRIKHKAATVMQIDLNLPAQDVDE